MNTSISQANQAKEAKSAILRAFCIIVLIIFCTTASAKPVDEKQAEKAVKGWLKLDSSPLGMPLGKAIRETKVYGPAQEPIYYVVYLNPSGFLIVSADDEIEPIIAFVSEGTYDESDNNPLGALVSTDLAQRKAAVLSLQSKKGNNQQNEADAKGKKHQNKWAELEYYAGDVELYGISSVSDVRVSPLVQSKWGQLTVCGNYCYNYYTPSHYPCGCVGTAMAQIIRYHQYPAGYNYGIMTLVPSCSTSLESRQAIGQLCYDAAEAADTSYGSGGSGAGFSNARNGLVNVFYYQNAIRGDIWAESSLPAEVKEMLNPNLDAGYPVLLGIHSHNVASHAVVCDGYGYNNSTLYHHINMGWEGQGNAWYNLPRIDFTGTYDYYAISVCIYNVFPSGSGEIISGRVTDSTGTAVSGAVITAIKTGGSTYTASSNSKGIYALKNVPSNSTFVISAKKAGLFFPGKSVTTGKSTTGSSTCGNLWAVDFTARTLTADFNDDGAVDCNDLAVLSGEWLKSAGYQIFGTEPNSVGLVLHYNFDETSGSTAYDSSAPSYNGAVQVVSTGIAKTNAWDSAGYDGKGCINFDGNTKATISSASTAFAGVSSAVSVSLWINGNAAVQPDAGWGMAFQAGNAVNDRLLLAHIPTPNNSGVMFESGGKDVQRLFWSEATAPDWEGQWNHYVFTLDTAAGKARIYCNGEKKAERAASTSISGISSFMVGNGFVGGLNYEYFGKIDDFKVYNYALSDDEVTFIANDGQVERFIPLNSQADLHEDDIINFFDFAEFAGLGFEMCQ